METLACFGHLKYYCFYVLLFSFSHLAVVIIYWRWYCELGAYLKISHFMFALRLLSFIFKYLSKSSVFDLYVYNHSLNLVWQIRQLVLEYLWRNITKKLQSRRQSHLLTHIQVPLAMVDGGCNIFLFRKCIFVIQLLLFLHCLD